MRSTSRFGTKFGIGAVALMAVLTACGASATSPAAEDASSDTVASNQGEDVETTTTTAEVDEGSAADSIWDDYESPIQKFLGFENQDYNSEEFQAKAQAEERTIQEAVVKCMAELGWEYKPEDTQAFAGFEETLGGLEYGSKEWVKTYGFGISTMAFSQEEVGPNLVGHNYDQFEEPEGGEYVDPNADYVNSLDDSAREAYYADLYGAEPDIDFENATEEEINAAYENWEPDGCQNQAWEESELFGGGAEGEVDFYESFSDELDTLYESVESDPRLVALNKAVEDCVAGKGLVYRGDNVWEYFSELMNPIQEEVWGSGPDEDPFGDVDFEAMTPEEQEAFQQEVEEFYNQSRELSEETKAKLGEIQSEEIELALAMEDCGRTQRGNTEYDKVFIEVLAEYEQDFLDRNAGALAEFEGIAGN